MIGKNLQWLCQSNSNTLNTMQNRIFRNRQTLFTNRAWWYRSENENRPSSISEPIPPLFAGCLPVRIIVIAAGLWADNDTFTSRRANDINASISFHFFFRIFTIRSSVLCPFFRHFFPGTDRGPPRGPRRWDNNCHQRQPCTYVGRNLRVFLNRGVCESARDFFFNFAVGLSGSR